MRRLLTSRQRRRLAVRLVACCPVRWHRRPNMFASVCRRPKMTCPRAELRDSREGWDRKRRKSRLLKTFLNFGKTFVFLMCPSYPAPAEGVRSETWCYTACSKTFSQLTRARGGWRWSPSHSCQRVPRTAAHPRTHCSHNQAGKNTRNAHWHSYKHTTWS